MLQNPLTRYKLFLYFELAVVIGVMAIFRFTQDPAQRPTAGLVAGGLFLASTLVVLILEWRAARAWTGTMIGAMVFLVGSVLPVLILRLVSWGVPFDEAELFGVTGAFLHRSSNLVFLLFLVGIFLSLQKARARG